MSEHQPLLGGNSNNNSNSNDASTRSTQHRLLRPVSTVHGDLLLLACCFVTGLIDCAAYNNYDAFAGMQTGNTVILFLSTTGRPTGNPYASATTLTSLTSFFAGAFVTSRLARLAGPTRRATMAAQFAAQALLVLLPALLTQLSIFPAGGGAEGNARIVAALAPLALAAGSTMATARLLGFAGDIPVNVLTSTYAALACDPGLFAWRNASRNRRVAAFVCIALGVLAAAWVQWAGWGVAVVYWIAGAVKVGIVGVVVFGLEDAEEG